MIDKLCNWSPLPLPSKPPWNSDLCEQVPKAADLRSPCITLQDCHCQLPPSPVSCHLPASSTQESRTIPLWWLSDIVTCSNSRSGLADHKSYVLLVTQEFQRVLRQFDPYCSLTFIMLLFSCLSYKWHVYTQSVSKKMFILNHYVCNCLYQ